MNEIKKIHLGRQPFTISVDAHKMLRNYLEAIEHQSGAKSEVAKEVESRMAELLIERGITGDKVILEDDVLFLKEQLGDPNDFKDEDRDGEADAQPTSSGKRLFRDTEHGMLAGVCSGLAAYFSIDATIVRIVFIAALFLGGAAIPVYLVLWLLMPEAKSSSDRLQMQGKAVTVDSIKHLVDQADVKGAAHRASKSVGSFLQLIGKIVSWIVGSVLVTIAICMFVALVASVAYLIVHHQKLIADVVPFPVGSSEMLFTAMGIVAAATTSLLLLIIGIAMARRKWQVPGWITASLVGLLLVAGAVGAAMGPDTVHGVRDRYEAAQHTSVQKVEPFSSVAIKGREVAVVYEKSDNYEVGVRYLGNYDVKQLEATVKDRVLTVDATNLHHEDCEGFCIADAQFDEIVIRAPKLDKATDMHSNTWYRFESGKHLGEPYYDYPYEDYQ